MAGGGTNNIKRPGYATGGPGGFRQPGFAPGGPNDPAMGGSGYMTRPGMGGGWGQMPRWPSHRGGMRTHDLQPGDPGWQPGMGGYGGGGWAMNIPGLLGGGGQNNPPGFPGYDNLPKNWQDEGYDWQDPNNPDATYRIIA